MVTTATLSFLAVLSLVLLLGAASYISRGAVRRGVLILFLAVGLSAISVAAIYPALRLTDGGTDEAFRTAEIEQLKADRDQLLTEVNQKARDNEALSKTSAFFSKLHKERLTRISEEIHSIKDIVLGPQSGMLVSLDANETTLTTFLDGPSGFESILTDLRKLKALRVRSPNDPIAPQLAVLGPSRATDAGTTGVIVEPAPHASSAVVDGGEPAPREADTLTVLRKALDSKMSTATYKVDAMSEAELVDGRKGRYYLIELKNPKTGNRFTFDSGKYTFQSSRAAYKTSFNAFAADVLKQLEGQAKFDLFVRGSADAQAYNGQLEPGFEYRKISYLPNSRGKYLSNPATINVAQSVKNTDLPNLRGEYLRGYLAELFPVAKVNLLEGYVTKKDNPAARNTELILFVEG
ncbi:MAG: hypothetical protein ABL901_05520 [Hyphomicrobiaceae bacterium]